MKALDAHLQQQLYPTAEAVARYVEQRWGVRYTASGMTAVLHWLGYIRVTYEISVEICVVVVGLSS